ncbi:protein grindelwald [Culex pipiens pallens]|uniref:protein grindelwald n=1 Tax=Culex pipiens pallens TaxID=42434 RepID=UPI00195400F9|nr:protein grindelwald [Culex pipiens pallens]XP_039438481.1 protein grindelwald [Culex pipiens pallens]
MSSLVRTRTMVWLGLVVLAALAVVSISAESEFCNDTKPCKEDEYCDGHSSVCAHCSQICTAGRPEFSEVDCNGRCKDYLILQRIATLENNLYTTIIIFAVVLVLLAVTVAIIIGQWSRKNGHLSCARLKRLIRRDEKSNPPPAMEYTHENPHTKSPKLNARSSVGSAGGTSHNGPLPLPPSAVGSVATVSPASIYMGMEANGSVRTTITSLNSQYPPSEVWRDNYAYDNGGMVVTPTENNYEYVDAKMHLRRT